MYQHCLFSFLFYPPFSILHFISQKKKKKKKKKKLKNKKKKKKIKEK